MKKVVLSFEIQQESKIYDYLIYSKVSSFYEEITVLGKSRLKQILNTGGLCDLVSCGKVRSDCSYSMPYCRRIAKHNIEKLCVGYNGVA